MIRSASSVPMGARQPSTEHAAAPERRCGHRAWNDARGTVDRWPPRREPFEKRAPTAVEAATPAAVEDPEGHQRRPTETGPQTPAAGLHVPRGPPLGPPLALLGPPLALLGPPLALPWVLMGAAAPVCARSSTDRARVPTSPTNGRVRTYLRLG